VSCRFDGRALSGVPQGRSQSRSNLASPLRLALMRPSTTHPRNEQADASHPVLPGIHHSQTSPATKTTAGNERNQPVATPRERTAVMIGESSSGGTSSGAIEQGDLRVYNRAPRLIDVRLRLKVMRLP